MSGSLRGRHPRLRRAATREDDGRVGGKIGIASRAPELGSSPAGFRAASRVGGCRVTSNNEITGSRSTAGKDVPAGTMAVVRSPDFLRALNQRDCACNIDPPAPSYAIMRRAPTAERTVGPARNVGVPRTRLTRSGGSRPELRLLDAAAQAGIVSVARIRLDSGNLRDLSKG